jgi:hypothetical protein
VRRPVFLLLLLVFALAGCTGGSPAAPTPTPPPSTSTGVVTITQPQSGAIIYGPTVYLAGTAENVPGNRFRLTAMTADDQPLFDTSIIVENGQWSYEAPNTRTGDPVELTISALPDKASGPDLDIVSIMLSNESQRPEGVFGSFTSPFDGDTVGGEVIPISGTASGLFEGNLNIGLEQPDGTVISGIVITVMNPGIMDEVPWQADMPTNGYRGPAVLRAYYHSAKDGSVVTLSTLSITVADAAG